MSEQKHTPGPWRTEAVSDAVRIVVGKGRGKIILARLAPPQISEGETHANARLIAAAPELLELLQDIEVRFLRWVTTGIQMGPTGRDRALLDRIQATLEKAEGK